jgi:dipeptide/tripeptide permease
MQHNHHHNHNFAKLSSSNDNRMLRTFRLAAGLLVQEVSVNAWVSRYFGWLQLRGFSALLLVRPKQNLVPTTEIVEAETSFDSRTNDFDDKERTTETHLATDNCDGEDSSDNAQWQEIIEDAQQMLHILPILLMFPIFWTLYDQQGSVWTLQATRMYLPLGLQPEQMNILNPVEILIFVPLFDQIIYPRLEERGINIRPVRRMAWGMAWAAVAFFLSALVESAIERRGPQQVHVLWQLPQITVLAVAEILLSVTGLEFSYAGAPDRLKAAMTALFLSTTGIGDVFSGVLYATVFENMDRSRALHVCAVLMLANLQLFLWVARWYEGRRRQQQHDNAGPGEPRECRYEGSHSGDKGSSNASVDCEVELQVLQRNFL